MSLQITTLNAGYGTIQVLFDVNMTVQEKAITVIVGPNGSGKSTLVKTIMGITKHYSGDIVFNNQNIAGLSPHLVTKLGIAYLPQVNNVFAELKVRENLLMASYVLSRGEVKTRMQEAIANFPVLQDRMNEKAGTLSGGQRQMLAMAMAIIRRPLAFEVLDKIVELRDNYGITIILVEQNARRALERGDNALLLVSGQVMYEGAADELLHHEDLGQLYLGIKQA
jgi:branched-chain amino acid transport system ATP-binding protein